MSDFVAAQVALPCTDVGANLAFFVELGFAVVAIFPADDPAVAVIEAYGVCLRLEHAVIDAPVWLRLLGQHRTTTEHLVAPGGSRVALVPAVSVPLVPPLVPSFIVTRADAGSGWTSGRAGMRYRDLVPDRQGGRFIASQIRIEHGGPVADWVHHHAIRLQLIYCYRGWVRVAYEDQGEPFVMHPGDCVLQPPGIRHRVLECAAGTEVIEIACPAEHETRADREMTLPTGRVLPERDFGGQRFVFYSAAAHASDVGTHRDLGLGPATSGLVHAQVIRGDDPAPRRHAGELAFTFVLEGTTTLSCAGQPTHALGCGDAVVIPAGAEYRFADGCTDVLRLEIAVASP